jgi:uncharacterized membrane protein
MFKITERTAILLMVLCTLFASTAHILLKFGANKISPDNFWTILNLPLFFGLIFFAIGALFMLVALKNGRLSVVFPILATSYIWISLLSPIFFPVDSMNLMKWIGVIVIIFSITLLGVKSIEVNKYG